jgi:Nucleotide-diphospho-sugar transferase
MARLHCWAAATCFFSLAQPASRWSERSRASFSYSSMLSRDHKGTQRRFLSIVESERDQSAELNMWLAKTAWSVNQRELAVELYAQAEILSVEPLQKQAAHVMRQFSRSVLDGTISTSVSAAVDRAALPSPGSVPILLAPLSTQYFELFELWLAQSNKHVHAHRLIMALDAAAKLRTQREPNCTAIDLSSHFVFQENGKIDKYCRGLIWVFRVMLLRELVGRGYTVYSLDLDAAVLSDLEPMLSSLPESDIVAQKDYSIPMEVARDLGFILCCGFMVIRPSLDTVKFLDRYCTQTLLELDDQLALNHLLHHEGITGLNSYPASMTFRACGVLWVCPDKSLVSRDLRHGLVIRHFQQMGESIDELKKAMGL